MIKESIKKNWDDYWSNRRKTDEIYADSERLVQNLIRVTDVKGKNILEVGAGTGRDSSTLAGMGAKVFLIDYSRYSMNKIKELPSINYSLFPVLGDALKLPFPDESFDIVFHQGLMEHFKDCLPLIEENKRVLKKNGIIVIDVPQKYHIYTLIKHIFIFFGKWFAGWETEFSIRELKKIVEENGFKVIHYYGEWMYPSLFYRIVREILKKIGLIIPMYPRKFEPFHSIRVKIREFLIRRKFSFYLFLNIGVIGKKEE